MKKLNVGLVRARNIVEIVTAISDREGISRAEIADRAGVSVMTVSNIMEVLLRNGAVYETEQRTENVGRNPALVYFSKTKWMIVINLCDWNMTASFVNLQIESFEDVKQTYDNSISYTENLVRLLNKLHERVDELGLDEDECLGISICLPSVYKQETDTTDSINIPPLAEIPIKATVRKYFGCTVLAGAAVQLAGLACNAKLKQCIPYSMLYLYQGESVRGALLNEGNVILGTNSYAGDLGQMEVAGGRRLQDVLVELYGKLEAISERKGVLPEALWDDAEAKPLLSEYVKTMGSALYNASCVFSPHTIVLDGSCVDLGRALAQALTDYVHPRIQPDSRHKPEVRLAASGTDNSMVGAGMRLREKWIKELN